MIDDDDTVRACQPAHTTMGLNRQPEHPASQPSKAGQALTQGVVELISETKRGLVFWSRQPLEIATEVQVRMRQDAAKAPQRLRRIHGFVIECKPARRSDGTVGFEISIVFAADVTRSETSDGPAAPRCQTWCAISGRRCAFGLN